MEGTVSLQKFMIETGLMGNEAGKTTLPPGDTILKNRNLRQ